MHEQVVRERAAPQPPPLAAPGPPPPELVRAIGPLLAFFVHAYQRHGPIFRMRQPDGAELVVMGGVSVNRFVSRLGGSHLRMGEFRQAQNAAYGVGRTLVSSDGAEHRQLRGIQKPGYSRAAIEGRHAELAELVRAAAAEWPRGAPIPLTAALTPIVARVIGRAVLRHDASDHEAALARFLQTVVGATLSGQLPPSSLEEPAYREARARSLALAAETIAARRCPAHAAAAPDLVADLLAAHEEQPGLLDADELRVAVLGPYIGGLEPVTSACAFLLDALLREPALLAAVRAELACERGCPGAPGPQLSLLRRAAMEALRRYPPTPVLRGTVARPFTLDGHQLAVGQSVVVGIAVPHFLPELFPDPLRFDPERYGPERQEHRRPGAYAPFGLGAHACLGAGIAEELIVLIAATLLTATPLALAQPELPLRIGGVSTPAPAAGVCVQIPG